MITKATCIFNLQNIEKYVKQNKINNKYKYVMH